MTDSDSTGQRSSFLSRACENCRVRKIRCDKTIPCSSCQALGIACHAATRAVEHRPRVVISSQYEKQIELIQERLHTIEKSIRQISNTTVTPRSPAGDELLASSTQRPATTAITAFEGDSSFGNQTLQASHAADLTVARVLGNTSNDEVSTALSSLKNSLRMHETSFRVHEAHLSKHSQRKFLTHEDFPPVAFVVALVKRIKVSPPFTLVALSWRDFLQLEGLCQKIYFPSEALPAGSVTLMHGLLYYLIRDYRGQNDPELAPFDYDANLDLCERNFSTGLETYESLTVPTLENVQALYLGAIKAQEESKLSLCWTFISAAYTMCQTLGYHRQSSLRHDAFLAAETKRHAFWSLYILDKNHSLNLGRTSNFQDYDVDAELFTPSSNPMQRPWDLMTLATIRFATIQGQIYDKLYSASGSKASPQERSRTIDEISAQLLALRDQLVSVDVSNAYFYDRLNSMVAAADFICYAVLTVVYRAQSLSGAATEISSKCFEAARLSLQSHLKCVALVQDSNVTKQSDYVNWILLYPSFTPFVVVFTHAIATMDTEELALLQDTVRSLEVVKGLSRGAQRLYDVCKAFLGVATAFINMRQTLTGLCHHDDGSLLLPPASAAFSDNQTYTMQTLPWSEETQNFEDMSAFLSNWLGTNRPVTDLLNLDVLDSDL